MKSKVSKSDVDRIIPPKKKREAIEQSERYEKEYEDSKRELDEILKRLEEILKQFEINESK